MTIRASRTSRDADSGAKCDRCKSPWHYTNQCPLPKVTVRAIPLNKRTAI